MKVIDPGHAYRLDVIDAPTPLRRLAGQRLEFVKRVGDQFPGNTGPAHQGPTSQEVIRALIDRTQYVNAQKSHVENWVAIVALREALIALEMRAAYVRDDRAAADSIRDLIAPELEPTCITCGHILCSRNHTP